MKRVGSGEGLDTVLDGRSINRTFATIIAVGIVTAVLGALVASVVLMCIDTPRSVPVPACLPVAPTDCFALYNLNKNAALDSAY